MNEETKSVDNTEEQTNTTTKETNKETTKDWKKKIGSRYMRLHDRASCPPGKEVKTYDGKVYMVGRDGAWVFLRREAATVFPS